MTASCHRTWVAVALSALALAGCGTDPQPRSSTVGASSADYVRAVEELLAPAGALASVASNRLGRRPAAASGAAALVIEADMELAELTALRLDDAGLAAQRRRLVRGFRPVLRSMRVVARHLARNDRSGLEVSAPQLFTALRELPSVTSA